MTSLEVPVVGRWDVGALESLPAARRYEVREGNLVIMSAAMRPWHADVQSRVRNVLVRRGSDVYIEQGVIIAEDEIRVCDVGVLRSVADTTVAFHPAAHFELLAEVVSEGSVREDRTVKPAL